MELTRRNIPFVKFGGLKFLDAAHVKDVLAILRFAQNPRDRVAGFRVAQLLPGVGPATAERIVEAAGGRRRFCDARRLRRAGQDARGFGAVRGADAQLSARRAPLAGRSARPWRGCAPHIERRP